MVPSPAQIKRAVLKSAVKADKKGLTIREFERSVGSQLKQPLPDPLEYDLDALMSLGLLVRRSDDARLIIVTELGKSWSERFSPD